MEYYRRQHQLCHLLPQGAVELLASPTRELSRECLNRGVDVLLPPPPRYDVVGQVLLPLGEWRGDFAGAFAVGA